METTQYALRIHRPYGHPEAGDERLTWDMNNPEEVETAREKFEELLRDGWLAFARRKDGTKERLLDFDRYVQDVTFEKEVLLTPAVVGG